MRITFNKKRHVRLINIAFLLTSSVANAAYVIVDDDMMPTQAQHVTQYTDAPLPTGRYPIPFAKKHGPLGPMGRAALDALIPQMRGQNIRIIGRPDANPSQLASSRANVIRSYLLRQGVSDNAITLEIDNTPNPQQNGSIYQSDIYFSRAQVQSTPPEQTYRAANTPYESNYPLPTQQTQRVTALTAVDKAARAQIIQIISRSAQTGQMDPMSALKMIQSLSNTDAPQAATLAETITQQQQIAAAPQLFVAANNTVRKQSWQLETTKTLRENIDAWALSAGWNPAQWLASNYYQVTSASTLQGDFPEVLRQIADGTKLNICVYQRSKKIKVTDSNVPCKD